MDISKLVEATELFEKLASNSFQTVHKTAKKKHSQESMDSLIGFLMENGFTRNQASIILKSLDNLKSEKIQEKGGFIFGWNDIKAPNGRNIPTSLLQAFLK